MRDLSQKVRVALGNECGGPNVEQIIGISVALAVGAGLFVLGGKVYDWLGDKEGARKTVNDMYNGKGDETFNVDSWKTP